ncbi:hypothetical protein C8Q76DRAFT_743943 [Earliella scabrosa]|nr:hypothetical protein C8Q76DRAFT_743943 [Earliella scabrosa]
MLLTSITTTPSSTTTFTSVHTTSTTPSESFGASANSDHSRSVPLRTIVGISIGGAAVLILAMLSLCYAVRRIGKRRRPPPQENDNGFEIRDIPKRWTTLLKPTSPCSDYALSGGPISTVEYQLGSPGASSSSALLGQPNSTLSPASIPEHRGASTRKNQPLTPDTRVTVREGFLSDKSLAPAAIHPSSTPIPDDPPQPYQSFLSFGSTLTAASTPSSAAVARRSPRTATDGGVRLAGGPPGEAPSDDEDADGETFPPPYRRY